MFSFDDDETVAEIVFSFEQIVFSGEEIVFSFEQFVFSECSEEIISLIFWTNKTNKMTEVRLALVETFEQWSFYDIGHFDLKVKSSSAIKENNSASEEKTEMISDMPLASEYLATTLSRSDDTKGPREKTFAARRRIHARDDVPIVRLPTSNSNSNDSNSSGPKRWKIQNAGTAVKFGKK